MELNANDNKIIDFNKISTNNDDTEVYRLLNFNKIFHGLSLSSENTQLTFVRRLANHLPSKIILLLLKTCVTVLYKRKQISGNLLPTITRMVMDDAILDEEYLKS